MDANLESWVQNLEDELKVVEKTCLLKSRSKVYTMELDEIKKESLKKNLTVQLSLLWDMCHYTTKQRNAFKYLLDNLYKDDTGRSQLAFYDIEVNNLKMFYRQNRRIFELLNEYKKQMEKLHTVGYNFESTNVSKNVKYLEQKLHDEDENYKLLTGKNFYSWGKTITQFINELSFNA